jgi:ribose transport system substrate-binding protein
MHRWLPVAILAALAGCDKAASAGPKKARFAFVTNSNSDFWRIAEKGILKAKAEEGVEVDIFTPMKGQPAEQQQHIETILVGGYDGMAISPLNPDAMTPLLDKAAAKLAVICHDSDAPRSKRKAYIGTNNVEAGRAAGRAVAEGLAGKGGKVAVFVGKMDVQNAQERFQGLKDALAGAVVEVLDPYLDHTDRTKAKANVEDALVKHPDLVACVGLWSYNGPTIADAVRVSVRAEKPLVVCFDEEEETLKAVREGTIFATVVQKPYEFGYRSIKVLKELKDGKTPPGVIDTGIEVVRKANVDEFWAKLRDLKK